MGDKSNNSQPAISLPKGGGAIKGIGETFQPNLFTGTGNFSVPIFTSPGRAGFGPQLTLQYSTGNGNGPFGLGWQLSIPRITRKTEKGLPKYTEEDVFVMSGAEDLVVSAQQPLPEHTPAGYHITRYRPRTEGLFARIEKWTKIDEPNKGGIHWRVTTKENITSLYGKTEQARISKPMDPDRLDSRGTDQVYEWLLQETYDAKGNHILYEYIKENPMPGIQEIYEQNRDYNQTYLRRILYGNTPDGLDEEKRVGKVRKGTDHQNPIESRSRHYVFEVLFDYGDQLETPIIPYTHPIPETVIPENWPVREDPFSTFRSGFEIRTLRRCRRVLMLHHFKEGELTGAPLVKSTDLTYENDPHTRLSILKSATITGYRKNADDGSYISSSMPPVEFGYSQFQPQKQHYQSLSARNHDLPPFSLKNPETTLVDLFGDGLPDILNTNTTGYHYWKNLGKGQLDMRHPQHTVPAGMSLSQTGVAFADLGGDGLPDLMVVDESISGFFEATPDGGWKPFKKINYPSFGLNDPNVRLVDLTGDGRSDALMTADHHFLWFECKGEEGYGNPLAVERIRDLDQFPDIYFNDPSGRVRLADMTGDGLNDIVLVHNGRIDYWPNLGYGRFGRRIVMQNSPRLPYDFDPSRLFLADLDGSGCADLVYVDFGKVHFWLNQSGNGWSPEQVIHGTPYVTDLSSVQFADVFGTGTATLVWSYDFDFQPGGNYKALDFCGGVKPYVLTELDNNMGATTRVQYAPSTKFYLEDRQNGLDWATNLPFPVQAVEKVEVIDHIGKTKLVTTYKYHHGYYDGRDREFRGFGRVDQFDTETFDDFKKPGLHDESDEFINNDRAFHVPPVETRSWFHTGIYFDEDRLVEEGKFFDHHELIDRYRLEYFNEDRQAFRMPLHEFEGTGPEAPHEAYRALRGALLRSEVYARDDTDKQDFPYVVTENRYLVKQLQSKNGNHHGVYLSTAKEALTYHYERNPNDPRVGHQITLKVDEFGNVTDKIAIGYPRRPAKRPFLDEDGKEIRDENGVPMPPYKEQRETKAIYSFARFINKHAESDFHYVSVPCENKTFEVHGLTWRWPDPNQEWTQPLTPFQEVSFQALDDPNDYEPFEKDPPEGLFSPKKRLIDWTRQYFRTDTEPEQLDRIGSVAHRLDFGEIHPLGLPYESYQAAFTNDFAQGLFSNIDLTDDLMVQKAGYHREQHTKPGIDPEITKYWWIPSGRQNYIEDNFFQPLRMQDPFGNITNLAMDCYALLTKETRDAKDNLVRARFDYRTLQPCEVIDPNNNHTSAAFDVLGMVAGRAIQGKITDDQSESGDSLSNFQTDLTQDQTNIFFNAEEPRIHDTHAPGLLKDATTRIIYDLNRFQRTRQKSPGSPADWQPVTAATLARERHAGDRPADHKVQINFSYSNGFGREIQKKIQAEGGEAPFRDPETIEVEGGDIKPGPLVMENGKPRQASTSHRWVGNGRTVFNNKGKPIKQYEPFFSSTHLYEEEREMTDTGVTPVLFFDPLERVVCTLHPNHTYDKVIFDAWQRTTWDVNDTVLLRPLEDTHVKGYVGDFLAAYRHPLDGRPFAAWYDERIPDRNDKPDIQLKSTLPEQRAALLTECHGGTATAVHLDSLGRPFLTQAHNGWDEPGKPNLFHTHVALDIEGNDVRITDPRQYELNRTRDEDKQVHNFIHVFDIAGRKLRIDSADAGLQLVLPDVSGNPLYAWDGVGHTLQTRYDELRRPTELWVNERNATDPFLAQISIYGEENPDGQQTNHRGQVWKIYDGAGLLVNDAYDFKGNLIGQSRRLVKPDHVLEIIADSEKNVVHWPQSDGVLSATDAERLLESAEDQYSTAKTFDALNRVTSSKAPDGTVQELKYNEANLLDVLHVTTNAEKKTFIENIDYNAKGQRTAITYGNSVKTQYEYDPETFRLVRLTTTRKNSTNPDLQDLSYTYDPSGNITSIRDDAHKLIFNHNDRIEPESRYHYDPLYRLIEATGREHEAMTACHYTRHAKKHTEFIGLTNQPVENGRALCNYVQKYEYDKSGNLTLFDHWNRTLNKHWRRKQTYASDSNRIYTSGSNDIRHDPETGLETSSSPACENERSEIPHDPNGNIERLPHLPEMKWDFRNQLVKVQLNVGSSPDKSFYQYDAAGQRVRKAVVKNGTVQERIYLGGFEIYTERNGSGYQLRRDTIHVTDDKNRIALIEIEKDIEGRTVESTRYRYQLSNHLGSSIMEIDGTPEAGIISYEEYYPYGDSAYIAAKKANGEIGKEVKDKRFRYSGKERDDETGLYYYRARYYASWVGRWASCDPAGIIDGENLFRFVYNNPINFKDEFGFEGDQDEDESVDIPIEDFDNPMPYLESGAYAYYSLGVQEANNPENSIFERAVLYSLSGLAMPYALVEEYVVRSLINMPHRVYNNAAVSGRYMARATTQEDPDKKVEDVCESVKHGCLVVLDVATSTSPKPKVKGSGKVGTRPRSAKKGAGDKSSRAASRKQPRKKSGKNATSIVRLSDEELKKRVQMIHKKLDDLAQGGRTTAIIEVQYKDGSIGYIVTISGKDQILVPAQREITEKLMGDVDWIMGRGEFISLPKGNPHAEMTGIATALGLDVDKILRIAPSRPACPHCEGWIETCLNLYDHLPKLLNP